MKKPEARILTLVLLISSLVISRQGLSDSNSKKPSPPKSVWLAEADWLNAHLKDSDLIIVDTRGEKDYAQGHIPGAILLDLSEISLRTSNSDYEVSTDELTQKLSLLGITGTEQIIFYDESTGTRAPKALWMLTFAGYSRGRVLHGGMANWQKGRFPLSWEKTVRPPRPFVSKGNSAILASTEYVASRIRNANSVILDVRSREEYAGKDGSKHCARNGRIPGAIWLEWTQLLEGSNYLPVAELQKKLFQAGLTPDKEVITYCHKGNRASNTYLALQLLGYARVRNYIGSWHEWAARLDLPIEKEE